MRFPPPWSHLPEGSISSRRTTTTFALTNCAGRFACEASSSCYPLENLRFRGLSDSRIQDRMGEHQAFPEGHLEGARFDPVELGLGNFGSGVQSLKESGRMSLHVGESDLDSLGLEGGHRAEVEQVARLGLVAAMPHLLGDDLGGCFDADRTPLVATTSISPAGS